MKREDKARKIKSAFIADTVSMIKKGGVEAVSARRLAEETGYSLRTLYKHFRNMDELFWHARSEVTMELARYLSASENGHPEEPELTSAEALRKAFHGFLNFFLKEPEFYRFLNFYRLDPAYKTAEAYHESGDFRGEMAYAFGGLVSEGYIRNEDIPAVSSALILSVQGMLTVLISGTGDMTEADARIQLDTIFNFLMEKRND